MYTIKTIKKKFYLLFIPLLLACSDSTQKNSEYKEIEYEEIYCPACDGLGELQATTTDRVVLGILTFGPGAICDTKTCEMCRGTGVVKRRKLNSK